LKGTHPGTIPARFGLIWFSGFRGENFNGYQFPTKMAPKLNIEKGGINVNCPLLL
jgi:hypothetical protein